ncbi:MAG: cytochrome c biogenesis protein CcsA [Bacteroidetes bacterium]|nr:cytochrome c biogenesis protein CcsA [Bacteroidota bacterium]
MKKALDILFSSKLTLILLLFFAICTGAATFIEDKFDTIAAQKLVYNARWFEMLMVLLVMNFIGNIKKYNLLSKQRIFGFLFHFAFILLILGAGVTRYFGYSGSMHIREGGSSNLVYTNETYLQIKTNTNSENSTEYYPLSLGGNIKNSFSFSIKPDNNNKVKISYQDFITNAREQINENVQGGTDILELRVLFGNQVMVTLFKEGEIKNVGKYDLAFNNNKNPDAIKIIKKDGKLLINSKYDIIQTTLEETEADAILKDSTKEFKIDHVYKTDGVMFAFSKLYRNATIKWIKGMDDKMGSNVLVVNVSANGKTQEIPVICNAQDINEFQDIEIEGMKFSIGWGQKEIKLPFSLTLDKFILDRYPGSMNPSSYKSDVTLSDPTKNTQEKHSIFMNNVLDYNGYRFFQSSYDTDEKGTILSVNHDFWGTWISYLGYLLICIASFFILISKNSRFSLLRKGIKKMRTDRKAGLLTIILIVCFSSFGFSQNKAISKEHAEKLSHLLVQTYDGRFEPLHTLAFDVMHKISRKDNFNVEFKGELNGMQAFWDMLIDQKFWKAQKIIYIREKAVKDALGIEGNASFDELFDKNFNYKLAKYAQEAFVKKPTEQNAFDKEIIKLDERANICRMVFDGTMLKLFPIDKSETYKWVDANDSVAFYPLTGSVKAINEDLQLPIFNYTNILRLYFQRIMEAQQTGDYTQANKIVDYIESIQRQSNAGPILPSKSAVSLEIFYNNAKIFENTRNIYGVLSLLLLSIAFFQNFSSKKNKWINWILNGLIGLLGITFFYHTFGLILRWYLSGHAPWSNGYEALLTVAWGGVAAGFYFMKYSKITLASTALLAFAMLMTAGHSSYDPQLTNLQPVLKSYWLIIHVAALTISYGFLGLAFMLGIINLFLYIFRKESNSLKIDTLISELTKINEMNMEIGLFLATIGTFLGGVWANESWGRYWGWDAKETWALVIVVVYAFVLHLRLVPKLKSAYVLNVGSVIGFSSVIMTFVGVNYYLSKGLHSYGTGDTPMFPIWAWLMIFAVIALIVWAGIKQIASKKE